MSASVRVKFLILVKIQARTLCSGLKIPTGWRNMASIPTTQTTSRLRNSERNFDYLLEIKVRASRKNLFEHTGSCIRCSTGSRSVSRCIFDFPSVFVTTPMIKF